MPKPGHVLVAAPTYAGKAYALDRYLAAYDGQTYSNRSLLLVDNTGDGGTYFRSLQRRGIPVLRYPPKRRWDHTQFGVWSVILGRALEEQADYIFSLEQDVIIPPDGIALMVKYATRHSLCFLVNPYPARPSTGFVGDMDELGCSLIDPEDLDYALKQVTAVAQPVDMVNVLRAIVVPAMDCVRLFDAEHLDDGPAEKWRFRDSDCRLLPQGADPATYARHEWITHA